MSVKDTLGDRCKSFESAAEHRAMVGLPLLARLDGRAFHTFTNGLKRPYDERLSRFMVATAKKLVEDLHACVAYTQSDEITLAWFLPRVEGGNVSQYPFDGRFQKLSSVLAGLASGFFCKYLYEYLPEKTHMLPHFDCRVWQVPTQRDALDVFVWREDDATKNSITMAASAYYSHGELQGKNSADKHELLHAQGVNWNDYPAFFKRGTYVQRRVFERYLTAEERARIPDAKRPPADFIFTRGMVTELDMPPIRQIENAIDVLFGAEEPRLRGAK